MNISWKAFVEKLGKHLSREPSILRDVGYVYSEVSVHRIRPAPPGLINELIPR